MRNSSRLSLPLRAFILVFILIGLVVGPPRSVYAATYTVNSLNDPGNGVCNATECTLREAMTAANASVVADTIQFSLNGLITLGSSLPVIVSAGGELTIDGVGRNVAVSGAGAYRPFHVGTNGKLNLLSLEVKNGYSWDGGGILNAGTLTIQDSTLSGNLAENNGGGIYTTGVLTLTNTRLIFNSTNRANGGGVYIEDGEVNVYGGLFQNNSAFYSGGAFYTDYQSSSVRGELNIDGAMFFGNSANNGDGGAIASESTLRINQSTFSLNSAKNNGGAVHHESGYSILVDKSLFSSNLADNENGGGLYVQSSYSISYLRDCTLTQNDSGADGGGFYHNGGVLLIERSTISQNDAFISGGGGYNLDGVVYLDHTTLESNQVWLEGGGFYNNDEMVIQYSTFTSNSASSSGGGVFHSLNGTDSTIINSTFHNNSAELGGGALLGGNVDVTNCTFSANSAEYGGGGGIYGPSTVLVRNSILANNTGGNCAGMGSLPANEGNNIDSGTTCFWFAEKGSMYNIDPLLGVLQDNGGYTQTMMPQKTSPAVDGVTYIPSNYPTHDQRDHPRPFGMHGDIGAVERYWRIMLPLVKKDG